MELFTTLLALVAFAYAIGVFAYDLLPGRLPEQAWRVAAYPFALMFLAEATIPEIGPKFLGVHPWTALIAGLIGALIDWIVTFLRRPMVVHHLEPGIEPAQS